MRDQARVRITVADELAPQLAEHFCRVGVSANFGTNFGGDQVLVLDCSAAKLLALLEALPDGELAGLDFGSNTMMRVLLVPLGRSSI